MFSSSIKSVTVYLQCSSGCFIQSQSRNAGPHQALTRLYRIQRRPDTVLQNSFKVVSSSFLLKHLWKLMPKSSLVCFVILFVFFTEVSEVFFQCGWIGVLWGLLHGFRAGFQSAIQHNEDYDSWGKFTALSTSSNSRMTVGRKYLSKQDADLSESGITVSHTNPTSK